MSTTLHLSDGSTANALTAGEGETLVLFHGVGMCAEAWEPQIAQLSAGFRVVAVDMPGHGATPALKGDPRLPDYVAWASRVLEALGDDPVSVAGHSMGSLIVGGLAVDHPNLVKRAALLNGVHKRDAIAKEAVLARAAEISAGKGDINGPLERWFGDANVEPRTRVAGWLRDVPRDGYAAAYRAFAEGDTVYADKLGQVTCPLLVLTGSEDPNSTVQMAETMAQMAPKGRAVIIQSHRHMVNLTAPEEVNDALGAWLMIEECAA